MHRIVQAVEQGEEYMMTMNPTEDQKDVLKVLWDIKQNYPNHYPEIIEIINQTGMEPMEVEAIAKQLEQSNLVEIIHDNCVILKKEGIKICRILFADVQASNQTPSFIQNFNLGSGGQFATSTGNGNVTSGITANNAVIGNGGSINIDAKVFFQELKRLVQESDEIPEGDKPGILANLKNLTYHPVVVALAQKAFELGIKGGA